MTAHVQFTQERELMLKEKELAALNTILTQERKVLLEKEEEIRTLRGSAEMENNNNVSFWFSFVNYVDIVCRYFTIAAERKIVK